MKQKIRDSYGLEINPYVFGSSSILILGFVLVALSFMAHPEHLQDTFGLVHSTISEYAGWFFTFAVNFYLCFVIYILLSPYGNIRLGGERAKPEFSTWSWFSMLFSAGMGIGLVFWSIAEPMWHYKAPPIGQGETINAAKQAMDITFFHWGLHAWGIYALVGLSLAYFSFNQKRPLTIRSIFHPLLKEKTEGPIGYTIDILAVVATLFGVATSLGLGVQQIAAGLNSLFGWEASLQLQIILIISITAIATLSVVSGVNTGIKRLSELNIILALCLLAYVFLCGPTLFLFNSFFQNTGSYFQHLIFWSTWNEAYAYDSDKEAWKSWQNSWTVFYWAWWIAWSPFVGMFIARISKGRTIREFILGVLVVPTLITFIWLTVFGGTALYEEIWGQKGIMQAATSDAALSLYALLNLYPLAWLTSILGVFVIVTFFVTSSDSGSLVIDIITADGHTDPPVPQRIYWAVMEGLVAAILLLAGGLKALQTASIATGLPFAIVLLLMCYCLYLGLSSDKSWKKNNPAPESK